MWKLYLLLDPFGVLTGWEIGDETRGQESGKYQRGESMSPDSQCSVAREDGAGPAAQQGQPKLMAQSYM